VSTKPVMGTTATGPTAGPLVARGTEAGDRSGVVCTGLFGFDNGPAMLCEREPSIQLAEAPSRGSATAVRFVGSSTDPGDSYGGTGCCRGAAVGCRGEARD